MSTPLAGGASQKLVRVRKTSCPFFVPCSDVVVLFVPLGKLKMTSAQMKVKCRGSLTFGASIARIIAFGYLCDPRDHHPSRRFSVEPLGSVAGFAAGLLLLIVCGQKCPKTLPREIPDKSSENIFNRNSRHISADWLGQDFPGKGTENCPRCPRSQGELIARNRPPSLACPLWAFCSRPWHAWPMSYEKVKF